MLNQGMKWADPYPLMNSLGRCDEIPKVDLEDHYKGYPTGVPKYESYFDEEYFYGDSNFHRNPFEDENDIFETKDISRDYSFGILGLKRSASDEDIKQAFRDKARETHPDKGGDASQFKEIREAYEILIQ